MSTAPDASCHGPRTGPAPRAGERLVAFAGNPNSGKSTLFNALTGAVAPTGNYPGVTVERLEARLELAPGDSATAVDLPGTYSLAARSPEERVAIDAILGLHGQRAPDVVVVVADAPRLQRSLYLTLQLLELEVPVVLALNMIDEARGEGRVPDHEAIARALCVPVVPVVARTGEGVVALREAVQAVLLDPDTAVPGSPQGWSEALLRDTEEVAAALPEPLAVVAGERPGRRRALALWLLLSADETTSGGPDPSDLVVARVRERAAREGRDLEAEIVGQRYVWLDAREPTFVPGEARPAGRPLSDRIDRVLLHPVAGSLAFLVVMGLVFQALFSWSDPAIGAIEAVVGWLGDGVAAAFASAASALPSLAGPIGILGDLLVNGIIGGVGAVVVFLPQIVLLFTLLALLEDIGYLARAAHLMDRILRAAGLPGQAFVPLLSGFACAVPAILATRTMPRFRDRLVTMMVLPLTSCSARLPVYTLLIAALLPATVAGWPFPVRPSVLMAIYLFSTLVTLIAAMVLGRTLMSQDAVPAVLELPPYRVPHLRNVVRTVKMRAGDFLREAGRVILIATVVLWALLSFPRYEADTLVPPQEAARIEAAGGDVDEVLAARGLEKSFAGQLGHAIEPAIRPLGFDWKIGVGLIGAFAAREVFVSTMGVVYGIGEADEESVPLREQLRSETHPDGTPRYTALTALSLMAFFALAMQCISTLAVLRKETDGWRWPAFVFTYMTALAWLVSFLIHQGGRLLI